METGESQQNLEARLAALEAMLGDVPPKVHNAFLSSLDARLGSGTGVGIKEGSGEGVGVAIEALSGSNAYTGLEDFLNGSSSGWAKASNGINSLGTSLEGQGTLMQDWSGLSGIDGSWQGRRMLSKRKEEEGVNEMAQRMEGMSFFYQDEIGQAKWQGASADFLRFPWLMTRCRCYFRLSPS